MGKIICMLGKSASGKDTLYKGLLEDGSLQLLPYVTCTTRPIRKGEQDGREYYFHTVQELRRMEEEGKVIECRTYQTAEGPWHYFTADDGRIDLSRHSYLLIGTLESYQKVRDYFGAEKVVPVYIEVEDGERLQRALDREKQQKEPCYRELCRRFLADEEDFSEENLEKAGIRKRFRNQNELECLDQIKEYLGGVVDHDRL